MSTTAARHSAATPSEQARERDGPTCPNLAIAPRPGTARRPHQLERSLALLADLPVGTVGLEVEGHAVVWRRPVEPAALRGPGRGGRPARPTCPAGGRTTPRARWAGRGLLRTAPRHRHRAGRHGAGHRPPARGPGRRGTRVGPARQRPPATAATASTPPSGMPPWSASSRPAADTRDHGATMMCSTAALQVNLQPGHPDQWSDRVRPGPAARAAAHRPERQLGLPRRARHGLALGPAAGLDRARRAPRRAHRRPRPGARVGRAGPRGAGGARRRRPARPGCRTTAPAPSLREWITDPGDWPAATAADVRRQLTTLFPPVRLRGWLELRCLDSLPDRWWPAVAALTTSWMDVEAIHPVVDRAVAAHGRPVARRPPATASATRCLRRAAATCLRGGAVRRPRRGPARGRGAHRPRGRRPQPRHPHRRRPPQARACGRSWRRCPMPDPSAPTTARPRPSRCCPPRPRSPATSSSRPRPDDLAHRARRGRSCSPSTARS